MRSYAYFCAALAVAGLWGCETVQKLRGGGGGLASGDAVQVSQVIKGDEVAVEKGGVTARVRMLGIQAFAPVLQDTMFLQTFGVQSAGFLRDHTHASVQVFFDAPTKDPYGRYLGYLQNPEGDLGLAMIKQGMVCVYTEFPWEREPAYLAAEAEARRTKAGLWNDAQASATVMGLRRNWREARRTRGDKVAADPLLGE